MKDTAGSGSIVSVGLSKVQVINSKENQLDGELGFNTCFVKGGHDTFYVILLVRRGRSITSAALV